MYISDTVCFHRLGLTVINLTNKFEACTFTHYEDMKTTQNVENEVVLGG